MDGPPDHRQHDENPAPLSNADFVEICASVAAQRPEYLRGVRNVSYVEHQREDGYYVSHRSLNFRVNDGIGSFSVTCMSHPALSRKHAPVPRYYGLLCRLPYEGHR